MAPQKPLAVNTWAKPTLDQLDEEWRKNKTAKASTSAPTEKQHSHALSWDRILLVLGPAMNQDHARCLSAKDSHREKAVLWESLSVIVAGGHISS